MPNMPTSQLIDAQGRPRLGHFESAPDEINIQDFDYHNAMGSKASRLRKWLGYNQFQYIGVVSDQLLVGCALGDFGYLGIAFVYVYQPGTGELSEFTAKLPLGRGISLTNRPLNGVSEFDHGDNRIRMSSEGSPRTIRLQIDLKSGLRVDARLELGGDSPFEPLALCTRTGVNGWSFTEKIAGVRATGTVRGDFGEVDLEQICAYGHRDYSVGYMRRETFWNWACFAGASAGELAGRAVGLNLSCGVNETSFSENCVWVDGKRYLVGLAGFDYNRQNPEQDLWTVRTQDGRVELEFAPEGIHRERVNAGILKSNFKQVFGRFNGTLQPDGCEPVVIKDLYGFVEEQYAKW